MLGPLTRQCLAHLLLLLRPKGLIYMTAKDELRQALLNTCSISDEALTLLNSILDGSGGGGGGSGLMVSLTQDGPQFTMNKTFAEIRDAMEAGINVLVEVPDEFVDYSPYSSAGTGIIVFYGWIDYHYVLKVFNGAYDSIGFAAINEDDYPNITFD